MEKLILEIANNLSDLKFKANDSNLDDLFSKIETDLTVLKKNYSRVETQNRKYEKELEKTDKYQFFLSTISDLSRAVNFDYNIDRVINFVLYQLNGNFDVRSSVCFIKDKNDINELLYKYNFNYDKFNSFNNFKLSLNREFHEFLIESDFSINKFDIITEDFFINFSNLNQEFFDNYEFEIVLPLISDNDLEGIIFLAGKEDNSNYEEYELEFIHTIAKSTAISMKNAENYKLLNKSIEQLTITNKMLDKKVIQLSALYELGKVISTSFHSKKSLNIIIENAKKIMKSFKCTLVLKDFPKDEYYIRVGCGLREGEGILENISLANANNKVIDYVLDTGKPVISKNLLKDPRFKLENQRKVDYKHNSFLSVPLKKNNINIGALNVTEKFGSEPYTYDDLKLLEILANQVVIAIENEEVYRNILNKKRIESELEVARSMQLEMLKVKIPKLPQLDIYATSVPCKEVGGDYFDIFNISDDILGIAIGDVSGKGIPAAFIMSMVKTSLKTIAKKGENPKSVIDMVNKAICENIAPEMFMTIFYMMYNFKTGETVYTNGGHNYPLVYRSRTGEIEKMARTGLFIGMFEMAQYKEAEMKLEKDDLVVMYTDGIIEAKNDKDEEYTEEVLIELIKANSDKSPEELKDIIFEDVDNFIGTMEPFDDSTLLIFKVK